MHLFIKKRVLFMTMIYRGFATRYGKKPMNVVFIKLHDNNKAVATIRDAGMINIVAINV